MAGEGESNILLETPEELKLVHYIRETALEEDAAYERKILPGQVQLMIYAGDRHIDDVAVDGDNLVFGFAKAGAETQRKLLRNDEQANTEAEADIVTAESPMPTNTEEAQEEGEDFFLTWEELRTGVPKYIESITFTVPKIEMTPENREYLEERYPHAIIQELGSNRSAKRQAAPAQPDPEQVLEKPAGVKAAVFELDCATDLNVEASIRKQYPWATIQPSGVPTGPRSSHDKPPTVGDVETHLQDFATYMTGYPAENEFSVSIDRSRPWQARPLPDKLRVAHARAIQHPRYGGPLNTSKRCGHCQTNGWICRIYRLDFVNRSASTKYLDLGSGCQHCRLLNKKCDLPSNTSSSTSAPDKLASNASPAKARSCSTDLSSDATVTTPHPVPRKLTLAERTNLVLSNQADMETLAKRLGLSLSRADVVWSMYVEWKQSGSVRAFQPDQMHIYHYYANLVDSYIMATATKDSPWQFAILLRLQATSFHPSSVLPGIKPVVFRAFEHLPVESPLCKWIAILYSNHQRSPLDSDFNAFLNNYKSFDQGVILKFLYAVACERPAEGGSDALLARWCVPHEHKSGSDEDQLCMFEERACKDSLKPREPHEPKKRSFYEDSHGYPGNKKFKPNSGHQHGSARKNVSTNVVDSDTDESDTDESDTDESSTDSEPKVNIGRQSLRSARGSQQSSQESSVSKVNFPNLPARPKKQCAGSSIMAPILREEHLASLENSEFDLPSSFRPTDDRTTAASETPSRDTAGSEEPGSGSGRRSARASAKNTPPGFFRQHLPKKHFANTMWARHKG
ncbi:hypothetical protein BU23DRAFT_534610 [Bimuria novae-zelandiae CBS 107.79]|uniref:Uncharacterized protein n=1 Tax=Bimuria novae-zelandiae CBS 107.79 TaxID=1447943 RepID=A0A6A5VCK5_9PLEO|nr:hypothetical protein BU23DRAFT_534610 [Bimuria novae-zelandiae CBS 107.79]